MARADLDLCVTGEPGPDQYNGGDGIDTVSYEQVLGDVTVTLDDVADDGLRGDDNVHMDVENVTGGCADDTLIGDGGDNVLNGGPGDDVVDGGLGADTLDGGYGEDAADYEFRTDRVDVM